MEGFSHLLTCWNEKDFSQIWDTFVFPGAQTQASAEDGSLGYILTTSGEQDLS